MSTQPLVDEPPAAAPVPLAERVKVLSDVARDSIAHANGDHRTDELGPKTDCLACQGPAPVPVTRATAQPRPIVLHPGLTSLDLSPAGRLAMAHANGDHALGDLGPDQDCTACRLAPTRLTVLAPPIHDFLVPAPLTREPQAPTSLAWRNTWVAVEMRDSHFGPFTTVRPGTGRGAVSLIVHRGQALVVRQPRYAVGLACWEAPRGGSKSGECLTATALREATEETGIDLAASSATELGTLHPDTGLLQTEVSLILITLPDAAEVAPTHATDGEVDQVRWVKVEDLVAACADGTVSDAFTVAAVLRAHARGLLTSPHTSRA